MAGAFIRGRGGKCAENILAARPHTPAEGSATPAEVYQESRPSTEMVCRVQEQQPGVQASRLVRAGRHGLH